MSGSGSLDLLPDPEPWKTPLPILPAIFPDGFMKQNAAPEVIFRRGKTVTGRWAIVQLDIYIVRYTVCPGSNDPFCIVTYHIKWVTTSWTHSIF